MRVKRKVVTFALAAMMAFSNAPARVFAAEDTNVETTTESTGYTESELNDATPTDSEASETTEAAPDTDEPKESPAEEPAATLPAADTTESAEKVSEEEISEEALIPDSDIMIAEDSAPVRYTITYVNGKTNPDNPAQYAKSGEDIVLNAPSWKGYTFKGWYSDAEYTNRVYKIAANTSGNLTFYAKWDANKYTIEFDGNGATSGTMKHMVCRYGEEYFLRSTNFYRKGYFFSCWNTKPDGSGKSYPDQDLVTNLRSGQDAEVTLYAQWDPISYNIEFKPYRASSGTMESKTYLYGETYKLPANAFKRTGYTFTGWNTKADGSGRAFGNQAKIKDLTSVDGNTLYLYPQWEKTKYKIVYNMSGGTNNSKNPATYTITSDTITLKDASRPGYIFEGWYSDSKYKNKVTTIPKGSTGKKTLYAKWSIRTYSISYKYEGTLYGIAPQSYTVETDTFTLPTPTLTGYKFCGWYKNSNYTGKALYNVEKGSYKNLHLYAKMVPISYKVVFMGNGATGGSVAAMNCTYDQVYKYPANGFTKTKSIFQGWSLSSVNGASLLGQNFKNLSVKDGATVYVYAQWTGALKLSRTQGYPINVRTVDKSNSINAMVNVTSITFDYTEKDNHRYDLTIHVSGTKTYERTARRTAGIGFTVTKSGTPIANSAVYVTNTTTNGTFTQDIKINNLEQGSYSISFHDYTEQ